MAEAAEFADPPAETAPAVIRPATIAIAANNVDSVVRRNRKLRSATALPPSRWCRGATELMFGRRSDISASEYFHGTTRIRQYAAHRGIDH